MPRSQGQGQGRKDWEFEISKYKLLYIKLINNKFLLYSTENYIQYLAINHNGKKNEKCTYIYRERERDRTESLCCTAEINTTL